MSSKLKVKTLKRRQQRRSGVFIVDSEQISHIALLFPLLTWNKYMPIGRKILSKFIIKVNDKIGLKQTQD